MKATNKQKQKMREYNKLHVDIINARAREWNKNNKERRNEHSRRFRKNHPGYFTGKTIRVGKKRIYLGYNPRKGICGDCGKTNAKTVLHHLKYDLKNPLAHTFELCIGCHARQHRLMKYKGKRSDRLYISR